MGCVVKNEQAARQWMIEVIEARAGTLGSFHGWSTAEIGKLMYWVQMTENAFNPD